MTLIEIEYGSLASSETMNKNFNYLDDKIKNSTDEINTNIATINSNIASINTSLENYNEEINSDIEKINNTLATLEASGMYITTYHNGDTWYREFFSDSSKTKRVWLEQGGKATTPATVKLTKNFSNTTYCVQLTMTEPLNGGNYQNLSASNRKTSSFYASFAGSNQYTSGCMWYACGI